MKKEDIEFLKQLKNDMLNGNTCSQASPRFWVIMDYEKRPVPENYGDEFEIIGDGDSYTVKEFKEYIIDNYADEVDDEEYNENGDNEQQDFINEIKECDDLNDIRYVMDNYNLDILSDFYEVYVKEYGFISTQTGAFLTKEDCDKHLKLNSYHYSPKAHSYALTGWRNPRFEKLLDIITKTDWDKENN